MIKGFLLFACILPALHGIELATGKMLGPPYDQRSFYVRSNAKGSWVKAYSGPRFKPAAAGRMMNLRVAQAITHDEWLTEDKFDPAANTRRVVEALDSYKQHGILAISVSFQGANPAYDRTAHIKRTRPFKLGPEKGSHNSAFRPDGSLKEEWLKRGLLLARELDKRDMILNPILFYAYQDELLEGPAAIDRAIRNFADWLIDNNIRNVLVEIANEYDSKAFDHDGYIATSMPSLISKFRARFEERKAGWRPPVGASTLGGMRLSPDMKDIADLTMVHGNNRPSTFKRPRAEELAKDPTTPGPVYMNEDDNGRETTLAHLKEELASCDAMFEAGGSWGYMPWVQLQMWPFRSYKPGRSGEVSDDMPEAQRDLAYFKHVLDHIRSLVMK